VPEEICPAPIRINRIGNARVPPTVQYPPGLGVRQSVWFSDGRDGALRRPRPRSSGRNEIFERHCQSKELRRCTQRGHRSAMSLPGRDVRPNVPDHFGGIRVRTAGSGSAQRQRKSGRVIPRSRVAKNKSGTLRTASHPVIGWRVDTNMPKRDCQSLLPGGTLSSTSLIFSAAVFGRPGRTRRKVTARLSPVRLFFIRTSRGKQMGR
jgi:hypothetical protein